MITRNYCTDVQHIAIVCQSVQSFDFFDHLKKVCHIFPSQRGITEDTEALRVRLHINLATQEVSVIFVSYQSREAAASNTLCAIFTSTT